MKHVIITRMGLARMDDQFYRDHINLCGMTLARSLEAQSDKDFIWVVAIDLRAPKWVDDAIKALAPSVKIEIWRRDPFVYGLDPVDKSRLMELADSGPIITTRIDDDDLLHRDFVTRTKKELQDRVHVTYLSFVNGYVLSSDGITISSKPWRSMGLSCLSSADLAGQAYKYSHTKTRLMAEKDGFSAVELVTEAPLWARTARAGSDSSEVSRSVPKPKAPAAKPNLSEFGISRLNWWRIHRMLKQQDKAPERPAILHKKPLPRLHMKLQILRRINELRNMDPAPHDEIEALATAIYSF